ncbi:MAG: SRPBCC family protein [Telluria sp.]
MNTTATELRSVVLEREFPYPVEKLWRALTQPHLLEAWLMKNDFLAERGRRFDFRGDWGSVQCEVTEVEPLRTLAYTWCAMGLESTVTWNLEPTARGTRLRLEQAGFRPDQEQAYQGAQYGWQRMLGTLEEVLAKEPA